MPKEGFEIPPLQNLENHEAEMIRDMFLHLDVEGHAGDGRLPQKLAHGLMRSLGIQILAAFLPNRVSLRDLLLYADAAMPEASELDGYAKTVSLTVSQNEDGSQGDITAQHLIDFQLSLNRVPPTENEANVYLSKMLSYDDCSAQPVVPPERFQKDLLKSARAMGLDLEEDDGTL
mmetsp:Transcript_24678/g.41719  ORF Transcript_24678/g.41719 Transcript_24678/m.41719 type:complete len:175 (-) Transcript_24678:143-667(-)|eukprot:CAMPEP_0114413832 /NCGR_PEP_ID=MMETSP0103-20121206/1064_1 /TAXON_ID=37642 ORGANISM="Paraphysomonas imperforata, Strain PA2" /NCGR_SAMPLE_ID=MMETSP0103 /ASSEMBLY_ACC=CAM_ASM_000201 /LENGTH=174 /DNA_ID=CAMNT_0001581931 /DNA_START=70 /DNA_END=594 /DNA_ORIENTATION=+